MAEAFLEEVGHTCILIPFQAPQPSIYMLARLHGHGDKAARTWCLVTVEALGFLVPVAELSMVPPHLAAI